VVRELRSSLVTFLTMTIVLLADQVLLLDEITVDLDVLARADLITFLRSECEEAGATIVYATHIFDGLESWPTHMVYPSTISSIYDLERDWDLAALGFIVIGRHLVYKIED
jgi:ABC-type uncharacterized transport system ATPase subunit